MRFQSMNNKILAIKRASKFSPNHIDNDAMILEKSAEALSNKGYEVEVCSEEEILQKYNKQDTIFSMARSKKNLELLENLENDGVRILNSVESIKNCHRENMMAILSASSLKTPKNMTVYTSDYTFSKAIYSDFNTRVLWVKKEGHINHREDITKVYSAEELSNILKEFERRGIQKASIMEHIKGDEIKFYAVPESDYFHWYYSNGSRSNSFDKSKLKNEIYRCSRLFDLNIYGGDAIIREDGEIFFIDVNDWPSFAPIRDIAAEKIADLIEHKVDLNTKDKQKWQKVKAI